MSLADVLARLQPYKPPALPSMSPVAAAVERVLARWPDVVNEPPESDRERIVVEMKRRLDESDWRDLYTSFVTSAAVALFDTQRRERENLGPLRQFYFEEIVANESKLFRSGMLAVYLGSYHPGAAHTVQLGRALSQVSGGLSDRWQPLLRAVPRLLDGNSAHEQLGQLMVGMPSPWSDLKSIGMRKPHDGGLMTHAHLSFVKGMAPSLKSELSINKLLDWLKPEGTQTAKSEGAAQAVAALLNPWLGGDPPAELKAELTTRLVGLYGDPRGTNAEHPWNSASMPEPLVAMLARWLTGQNIQFFMDVVSEADPDPMFPPRRKFWMQLHQEGRIDDAWVALSDHGASIARRRAAGRPGLAFGHQTAGANRASTCLLILKIGRKIVVEGSHSYKVHIFDEAAEATPKLHRSSYNCEAIRLIKGAKAKPHLGDWQGWVREHI